MKFHCSRHARRRLELYKIDAAWVEMMILDSELGSGMHEVVSAIDGQKFPIKAVYTVEDDRVTLITAFPVKKRRNP